MATLSGELKALVWFALRFSTAEQCTERIVAMTICL